MLIVLGGGCIVTEGDALQTAAIPHREKIGAERPDLVLEAQKIGTDDLLSMSQVRRLDPEGDWKVVDTDENIDSTTPYATCPTKRFANSDPLRAFVRTYRGDRRARRAGGAGHRSVAEPRAGRGGLPRMVSWYSDCEHPRGSVGSYVVQRPLGDFRILRLRSHRSPERTFTVGFSHSGTVTSTLVHEVDGASGPDIDDFALTLSDSVKQVCKESGGRCTDDIEVVATDPPRTSEAPEFLGIVDLPPIADIDKVWAGVKPFRPEVNPAATQCDSANFRAKSVRSTQSRIFVIPEARELPKAFGVAETVGRFGSDDDAKAFVKAIEKRVAGCQDDNLSAKVDQEEPRVRCRRRHRVAGGLEVNENHASTTGWPSCARVRRRPGDLHPVRQVRHQPEGVHHARHPGRPAPGVPGLSLVRGS